MRNPPFRQPGPAARRTAERQSKPAPRSDSQNNNTPVEKLLHELQVHQVELEMQNETLRLTQLSLEEARDRYQSLYEFAPVGYLTLTAEGVITEINLAGANFLGMERRTILQKSFTSFVAREDQNRWIQHHSRISTHDRQKDFAFDLDLELTLKRSDNAILHAQLNCTYHQSAAGGQVIRVALTDITLRKRAESEKKHSSRRIESLMRHANDAILMFDAKSRIIDVSDSCLTTYGHSRQDFLDMELIDLRAPNARLGIPLIMERLSELGALSYQTWHSRADGNCFPVQVGATMIEVDGNRYIQKIVRDISESMRQRAVMERGLETASRRLLELSRHLVEAQEDARRRLSGELHDYTSPNLAAIRINLGMIISALSPGTSPEFGERLADTVALLEDTEISIREICSDLRSPIIDYAGLSAAMEEYARRYASRTGIRVLVLCHNAATRLAPALESLLFRIFQEALTNSLKHAKAQLIEVAVDFDATPIVLTIDDDGIGFDPAKIDSGASKSGMGLGNMREMAEFAGGLMTIESCPGRGTRISVSIES